MRAFAVALLFGLLLAGSARAQFDECVSPVAVPEDVFDTIIELASIDFGDLDSKVCQKITNQGVSTCKAQVKAAAKCENRSVDALYDIAVKQCNQLEDPEDRSDCKSGSKENKQGLKADTEAERSSALAVCEGDFAEALADACAGIPG